MSRWLFWPVILTLCMLFITDLFVNAPLAAWEVVWCVICIFLLIVTEEIQ